MTKFKVGDIAEFITKEGIYECGDVVEVIAAVGGLVNVKGKRGIFPVHSNCLILVARKLTKNQRITALEKEMSELRYFKKLAREMEDNSFHDLERITEMERCLESLEQKAECIEEGIKAIEKRIEHLEQEINQRLEVPNEPLITVEDKPKTPNQQRREIIEKAKEFVNYLVTYIRGGYTRECKYGFIAMVVSRYCYTVDFQVGGTTTIAKLALVESPERVMYCGVANCHPSDVFNEHIGKAIALGRALGLDVSEFEQAVQPTEAVAGMIVQDYYRFKEDFVYEINRLLNIKRINAKLECYRKGTFNAIGFSTRILNDTNAQYGGDE